MIRDSHTICLSLSGTITSGMWSHCAKHVWEPISRTLTDCAHMILRAAPEPVDLEQGLRAPTLQDVPCPSPPLAGRPFAPLAAILPAIFVEESSPPALLLVVGGGGAVAANLLQDINPVPQSQPCITAGLPVIEVSLSNVKAIKFCERTRQFSPPTQPPPTILLAVASHIRTETKASSLRALRRVKRPRRRSRFYLQQAQVHLSYETVFGLLKIRRQHVARIPITLKSRWRVWARDAITMGPRPHRRPPTLSPPDARYWWEPVDYTARWISRRETTWDAFFRLQDNVCALSEYNFVFHQACTQSWARSRWKEKMARLPRPPFAREHSRFSTRSRMAVRRRSLRTTPIPLLYRTKRCTYCRINWSLPWLPGVRTRVSVGNLKCSPDEPSRSRWLGLRDAPCQQRTSREDTAIYGWRRRRRRSGRPDSVIHARNVQRRW